MLQSIPAARLPHEWETIGPALSRCIDLDPERDAAHVFVQGVAGELQFWRVAGSLAGFLVTQVCREPGSLKRALWVIYVAGQGGSIKDKRELMDIIELHAIKARCGEVRFEGRDWRKVFPDYSASQSADGRWHFRKRLV